jgi:hypothetical protein
MITEMITGAVRGPTGSVLRTRGGVTAMTISGQLAMIFAMPLQKGPVLVRCQEVRLALLAFWSTCYRRSRRLGSAAGDLFDGGWRRRGLCLENRVLPVSF